MYPIRAVDLLKLAEEQRIEYEEYKNNQGREEATDFTDAPGSGKSIKPKNE